MKITIDIDCTPAEARAFFGLPDVAALQEAVLAEMQAEMTEKLKAMDPEAMFKAWMPTGLDGFENMQKAFWSQMTGGASKSD